jgi:predicted permease
VEERRGGSALNAVIVVVVVVAVLCGTAIEPIPRGALICGPIDIGMLLGIPPVVLVAIVVGSSSPPAINAKFVEYVSSEDP